MPKTPRPWIVTRHDPIEKLEDNLWAVQGDVPGIPFKRRMFIIKRSDGTLMFFGMAIPVEDQLLAEITAWGRPSILVVAHDQHMIDARAFAERLGLKVYGPKPCEAKMRARVELAGVLEDVPPDPNVQVMPVAGTKAGEPAVIVKSDGGRRVSLLVSDVLQNNPKDSLGLLPRLMGFGGGPKIGRSSPGAARSAHSRRRNLQFRRFARISRQAHADGLAPGGYYRPFQKATSSALSPPCLVLEREGLG